MDSFSSRLRTLRDETNVSQKQLATAIEYSQGAIAKWEKGISEPPTSVLARIANYFHTTVDYLVGISDDRRLPKTANIIPDDMLEVTPFEREVLLKYRILPPSEQIFVCRMLELTHPATRRDSIKQA